jgi:hypothetical protein
MGNFYDRKGQPMTLEEWSSAFEDFEGRRIAADELYGYTVSTVWLGADHGFGRSAKPLIFESMVFHATEPEECRRYATEDEARAGHAALVAEVKLAHGN